MARIGIGRFAQLARLSVRALRLYDELGVLEPAAVDPATGYRAYDPAQLEDAGRVRALREADLPLAEIAVVLRDPAREAEVLARHRARLLERLEGTRRALERLDALTKG